MTRLYLLVSTVWDAPDALYDNLPPEERAALDYRNFTDDYALMWDTLASGIDYFTVGVVPEDHCLPIIGHHVQPHIGCILR
jgi:hypothetical protein